MRQLLLGDELKINTITVIVLLRKKVLFFLANLSFKLCGIISTKCARTHVAERAPVFVRMWK